MKKLLLLTLTISLTVWSCSNDESFTKNQENNEVNDFLRSNEFIKSKNNELNDFLKSDEFIKLEKKFPDLVNSLDYSSFNYELLEEKTVYYLKYSNNNYSGQINFSRIKDSKFLATVQLISYDKFENTTTIVNTTSDKYFISGVIINNDNTYNLIEYDEIENNNRGILTAYICMQACAADFVIDCVSEVVSNTPLPQTIASATAICSYHAGIYCANKCE